MISHRSKPFNKCFARLPEPIQRQAREAYRDFKRDPNHRGLRFKPTKRRPDIWSVRITLGYRALGVRTEGVIVWFWIGSHADYTRQIAEL